MKNLTLLFCAMALILTSGCEVDSIDDSTLSITKQNEEKKRSPRSQAEMNNAQAADVNLDDLGEACTTVNLLAGQHHVAGDVSIYNDGENLIVVYTSNGDWDLGTTHLALGNCDEDWVPLTNSGNPKNGKFDYVEPYSATADEVVYVISLEGLDEDYCFAAHAEVQGPTGGETAWADGTQFSGRGWAMFVEASLSDCPDTDDGGGDGGGENQPT